MPQDLLPPWPLLAAFLGASFLLAVTPGPGVLYIVTRSVAQGRRSGLTSVAGVALGNLGNALGASIGLAALFAVSSAAFTVVKYAGALYLIYLGIQTLRAPRSTALDAASAEPQPIPLWRIFRDGFFVALLNPKTAIFFAAFLPQFVHARSAPMLQSALLGSIFVAIAAVTDATYAISASAIAPSLRGAGRVRSLGRYISGGVFIGLGLLAAFSGNRQR